MVDPGVRGLVVEGQLVVDQGEFLQHCVGLLRLFLEPEIIIREWIRDWIQLHIELKTYVTWRRFN